MEERVKTLQETEKLAYFRAELVGISPESYSLEEKRRISRDMDRASAAIEDAMRQDFAALDEESQTVLLDKLGADGGQSREWWRRMLMDGPEEPGKPTL